MVEYKQCEYHGAGTICVTCGYGQVPVRREPYRCPVCSGSGLVSRPPWVAGDQNYWTANNTGPYRCTPCNGTGLLWSFGDF